MMMILRMMMMMTTGNSKPGWASATENTCGFAWRGPPSPLRQFARMPQPTQRCTAPARRYPDAAWSPAARCVVNRHPQDRQLQVQLNNSAKVLAHSCRSHGVPKYHAGVAIRWSIDVWVCRSFAISVYAYMSIHVGSLCVSSCWSPNVSCIWKFRLIGVWAWFGPLEYRCSVDAPLHRFYISEYPYVGASIYGSAWGSWGIGVLQCITLCVNGSICLSVSSMRHCAQQNALCLHMVCENALHVRPSTGSIPRRCDDMTVCQITKRGL